MREGEQKEVSALKSARNDTANGAKNLQTVHLPWKLLGLVGLFSVTYFAVSGGAYGLEPLVYAVGPGWAIVAVLLAPVMWSLPISLMVAELASAIPEQGGYYVWVREGLGQFWGTQIGWLVLCGAVVNSAIYPVMFVNYLSYFYPSLALTADGVGTSGVMLTRWLIALTVITTALAVNWRGAHTVGRSSTATMALVTLPFALLTIIGLVRAGTSSGALSIAGDLGPNSSGRLLALGLSIVLWNYCGFEMVSTFAGEVHLPQRNYPRTLFFALPFIVAVYLLPLLAGIRHVTDPRLWSPSYGWPHIARAIGGEWMAITVALAALFSAYSLFNSQLLSVSRLPYVMALKGWLPRVLARTSQRTGMPTVALSTFCGLSAMFAVFRFGELVILNTLIYSVTLALQFSALIALRLKRPEMKRPFRIPGGWPVISLVVLTPMCLSALVFITSLFGQGADPRQVLIAAGIAAIGVINYFSRCRAVKEGKTDEGISYDATYGTSKVATFKGPPPPEERG